MAKAAADNLIPCILELGGKCPVIVDQEADVDFAAFKTVCCKFQNAGQTCIGVDYVLCHESKIKEFVDRVMIQIKNQFNADKDNPSSLKYNPEVGKIVAKPHIERLKSLIDDCTPVGSSAKVLIGGTIDVNNLYLPPTVILNPAKGSKILKEEIFGPILPIIPFVNFDEVINEHIRVKEKPLAIYYFGHTTSNNFKRIVDTTSSGSVSANDILS